MVNQGSGAARGATATGMRRRNLSKIPVSPDTFSFITCDAAGVVRSTAAAAERLHVCLAMADEPRESQPLDYLPRGTRGARPPLARSVIVALIGAATALLGVIIFLSAHVLSTPAGVAYNPEDRRLHELLWGAFGIALLLAGALIAAVGLALWCRTDTR
jgi:hypothetical protein